MVTFVGKVAGQVFQSHVLDSAINLMLKGIKPNRNYTWKSVAAAVGGITGKTYAGKKDAHQMKVDLGKWRADNLGNADIRP